MRRTALRWLGRVVAAAFTLVLLYQLWIFAHVLWWIDHDPASTAFMAAGLARQQEKNPDAELRHKWVPYDRISIHLKRAIVAAEDAKFLEHEGFDVEGIQAAVEKNLKKGRLVAGGSTISQQLAKNLFLSGERSFFRKGQEAHHHADDRVDLEQAAHPRGLSQRHRMGQRHLRRRSRRPPLLPNVRGQLDRDQAARLAAMVPNPRRYETTAARAATSAGSRHQALHGRRAGAALSLIQAAASRLPMAIQKGPHPLGQVIHVEMQFRPFCLAR
jgi:monofunctional glycosyltransferase